MLEAPAVEKKPSDPLSLVRPRVHSLTQVITLKAVEASWVTTWKRFPQTSQQNKPLERKKKKKHSKEAPFIQISDSFKETSFWI